MSAPTGSTSISTNLTEDDCQAREQIPLPYTEPLSLKSLRTYFGLSADKMKRALGSLQPMEMDGKYRIPIRLMPTSYWIQHGLLRPVSIAVPEISVNGPAAARELTPASLNTARELN